MCNVTVRADTIVQWIRYGASRLILPGTVTDWSKEMSEEHSWQTMSPAQSSQPAAVINHLVRRAMSFFETDRAAAWRCLNDASNLLGRDSSEPSIQLQAVSDPHRGGGGLPRWRAKRVLAYIEANLGSKIAIGEIASSVALSKSHFTRAFKQSLGSTPMSYVAKRRVERAKVMMTSSQERLSDIALACGFADQSHLNRHFCRVVGVSPGQWRRSVAKPDLGAARVRDRERVASPSAHSPMQR
jgi:AraC family transcriptional regulator